MQNPSNTHQPPPQNADELASLCDVTLDPLFWRADRVDALSAWSGHIPFAHWLVATLRPQSIVELGTHSGVSYAAFCAAVEHKQLATRCYAVDTWKGDEHAGQYGDQVYADLHAYNQRRFGTFSTLLRTTFDDAVQHFPDASIDLLHIDGLHTYEAVRHDFEKWLPKLSARAVVLFHDTNEKQRDFGVWRLWSELKDRYPSFEFLHGHGLGVLATGADPAVTVQRLCRLDASDIATVRNRFAMLGERWEAEQRERWQASAKALEQQALADGEAQRRAEVDQARQQLLAAEAALNAATQRAEAEARERAALERNLSRARARILAVEDARADLEAQMEEALEAAEDRASTAETALHGIESSTVWRATRPLRSILARTPPGGRDVGAALRSRGRRLAKQLPSALGGRARLQENVRVISSSPLFDVEWYVQQYPEAGAAGVSAAHHYATTGSQEGHDPGPLFDAEWYLKQNPDVAGHGISPLVHFEKFGRQEGRAIRAVDAQGAEQAVAADEAAYPTPSRDWKPDAGHDLHALLAERFAPIAPLRVFRVAGQERHVTLVTDSVNGGALAGDPRAALAFAATLASRIDAGLRIVTRVEPVDAANVDALLRRNGIAWNRNIDFVFSAMKDGQPVALGMDDLFVTTSWWITRSAIQVIDPRRIIHLMQDDERARYANGDEQLRCAETIATPGLRHVVDTRLLFDHLAATRAIGSNEACWFDPALPQRASAAAPGERSTGKRQFFFHARPDQPRHLYWRGLEVIGACLEDGILNAQDWDIHFVGAGLTPVELPGGVHPRLHEPASLGAACDEYLSLAESADVALCLMESPHPGYVALDLAAAGAQVVTNRYGVKTSLEHYSPNLLCADPDLASLKETVRSATQRKPARPVQAVGTCTSWEEAFAPVFASLDLADAGVRPHV